MRVQRTTLLLAMGVFFAIGCTKPETEMGPANEVEPPTAAPQVNPPPPAPPRAPPALNIPGVLRLDADGFSNGPVAEVQLIGPPGLYTVKLKGSASGCKARDGSEWPSAVLTLEDGEEHRTLINSEKNKHYEVPLKLEKSGTRLTIGMVGDHFQGEGCDRNMFIAEIEFIATAPG